MRGTRTAIAGLEDRGRGSLTKDCRLPREVGNGPQLTHEDVGSGALDVPQQGNEFCQHFEQGSKQIFHQSFQKGMQL